MGETTIRLGETGSFFATRHMGQQIRERIEALPPGESVVLDWAGVNAITVSFGDELAGKLLAAGRPFTSTGACPDVQETLDLVQSRRVRAIPLRRSGAG